MSLSAIYLLSAFSRRDVGMAAYLANNLQTVAGTWCWGSVCPKQSLLSQAKTQVKTSGAKLIQEFKTGQLVELLPGTYLNFYSIDGDADRIRAILFALPLQSVSLGEAYHLFGMPIAIQSTADIGTVWHRRICFKGGLCADFEGGNMRLSPYMWLTNFILSGTDNATFSPVFRPWSGFVSVSLR